MNHFFHFIADISTGFDILQNSPFFQDQDFPCPRLPENKSSEKLRNVAKFCNFGFFRRITLDFHLVDFTLLTYLQGITALSFLQKWKNGDSQINSLSKFTLCHVIIKFVAFLVSNPVYGVVNVICTFVSYLCKKNYYMAESVFAMRLVNLRSVTCYTDQNFKENAHFGALNLFT